MEAIMTLREQEERLFAEWKQHWSHHGDQARDSSLFCEDGVVDENSYLNSSLRILFVLKEVNGDFEGKGWDLRKFLYDEGGRPATWGNITRWIEGIRQLPNDIPWREVDAIDSARRRKALRSIAAVNLKKSPGGHTAFGGEVALAASKDQELLKRQFALYDPDLIICCGTRDTYERLFPNDCLKWRTTLRGIEFCERTAGKYIIDYAHPGARVADCLKYYGLMDALREILSIPNHKVGLIAYKQGS